MLAPRPHRRLVAPASRRRPHRRRPARDRGRPLGAGPPHRRRPRRHQRPGAGHHAPRRRCRRSRSSSTSPSRSSARWPGSRKVEEVRSISKYGLSVVTVVFNDGTDIYFARQMVLERMREAEEAVPAAYGRPEMGPIATGLGEIYQFVVRGEGHSLMELEETLDWYIGPQLRTVPGHRRGQQLRRRGQAVPGRHRSQAAPGRRAVGRAR